ncbi:MAG: hypothetical protein J7498_16405 [Sphingobium sp.]|nr:hypothetical protein [Sphingobium sp.]
MTVQTSPALREALRVYSDIERNLVGIGKAGDPSRRLELVRLRRKLAEQTGTVGTLIEQDAELAKTPDKQQEMQRVFSAFRYAFGHHQAKWPVVCADAEVAEYVASARETYGKADLFWAWCADNLDLH